MCGVYAAADIPGQIQHKCASLTPEMDIGGGAVAGGGGTGSVWEVAGRRVDRHRAVDGTVFFKFERSGFSPLAGTASTHAVFTNFLPRGGVISQHVEQAELPVFLWPSRDNIQTRLQAGLSLPFQMGGITSQHSH